MLLLFAWAAVIFIFVAPYPTTLWILKRSPLPSSRGLSLLVAAGLGIGTLTWLMMLEGMLGIPFQLWTILLPYGVVFTPGTFLWWRGRPPKRCCWRTHNPHPPAPSPLHGRGGAIRERSSQKLVRQQHPKMDDSKTEIQPTRLVFLGRWVVVVVSAAIVLNAVYWPFYKMDAVGIYADQAHFMYATQGLIPLNLTFYSYYQAYPMLLPLSYTYTYLASGWEDPYLAKIIPTLLSLACLGAVFYLGKALYDERSAWLAVLLLALAPLFGRWASSGYADLPMAFYYTLAALFAWRVWTANNVVDALISGVALGLGAWTKNAMLPAIAFWLVFMLLGVLRKHISIRALMIAGIACALVAAPWYIRNLVEAHLLMPATVWTDQAGWSLSNILVLITHPENFALTGWLIFIGIGLGLAQVMHHPRGADRELMLLIFTLPYFAFWWLFASYDRRFVLYFLPILAVLAAGYSIKFWERVPRRYQPSLGWLLTIIALGMSVYIASISVDYKREILRDPFMNNAAKHAIVSGQRSNP